MNKTQEKALQWLIQQGHKREDLTFRQNKSPNFIDSNNKKFEVKRLYGTQIIFYNSQVRQLRNHSKTLILIFRDNESKPFQKFKFEEISSLPKRYKGIEINWVGLQQEVKSIRLEKKTKDRLESFGRMGENYDKLINRLLDTMEKSKKKNG